MAFAGSSPASAAEIEIVGRWFLDVSATVDRLRDDEAADLIKELGMTFALNLQDDHKAELTIVLGGERQRKSGRWKAVEDPQRAGQFVVELRDARQKLKPQLTVVSIDNGRMEVEVAGAQHHLVLRHRDTVINDQ